MNKTLPSNGPPCPECPVEIIIDPTNPPPVQQFSPRLYELTNHLGNVTTVFSEDIATYNDIFQTSGSSSFMAPAIERYREYTPFGLDIQQTANSPYNTTGSYRYGFNGKESDENNEFGAATHYDYGFRIYNPAIARFLSVDPLAPDYPELTTYQFASNRPIDGIDLDGLEWKAKNHWRDAVSDDDLKKVYGTAIAGYRRNWVFQQIPVKAWEVHKGMTYVDLYREQIGKIQMRYFDGGARFDCADFTFLVLTEFAHEYKLPIHIEDYKMEQDPTFNNSAYGYTNPVTGEVTKYEEGDWQSLAKDIGRFYGASDVWSRYSRFTRTKAQALESIGSTTFSGDFTTMEQGDIMSYDWRNDDHGRHAQVLGFIYYDESNQSIRFSLINASSGNPLPAVTRRSYLLKDLLNEEDTYPWNSAEGVRLKEWNFDTFDNNSGQ